MKIRSLWRFTQSDFGFSWQNVFFMDPKTESCDHLYNSTKKHDVLVSISQNVRSDCFSTILKKEC